MHQLPTATPESLGIPSSAIEEFLAEIANKKLCLHSFILLRHGKIAAEGYWQPFTESRKQRIYSISKSFTAAAVGLMIDEGKLSLDSKIADFFPEYLPPQPHKYVLEVTVRDLLIMSTCNNHYPYTAAVYDTLAIFFQGTADKRKPGAVFQYDTVGTTLLCAIVEKLAGKPLLQYMRRVLDEIGFSSDAYCIQLKEGVSWTGSGIVCTAQDLARFALLCMNNGAHGGKQLISADYMKAATSKQIDSSVNSFGLECNHGYGYQMWILRQSGFFMYGMGGQYAVCDRQNDTILVATADTQGIDGAGDMFLDMYFRFAKKVEKIGKMGKIGKNGKNGKTLAEPLAENSHAYGKLQTCLQNLQMPRPAGEPQTPLAEKISGRTYVLQENSAKIEWIRLIIGEKSQEEKSQEICRLQYKNASGEHELIFGMSQYEQQLFPEKYFGQTIGVCDTQYPCIAAAAWTAENTLIATLYAVGDYLGSVKFQFTFADNEFCGCMTKAAEWFFEEYQGFLMGVAVS
ncbi:MAG: beta-lactamase family protein [Defluviitaleaceae bacterium]|nr:beta-lactamase family protein [Defluviitaleaceae bacterium]